MQQVPAILLILLMAAETPAQTPQAGYERSGEMRNQSRSVVMAKHGLVATSHPLAAQAGLDVLKAGGSAADSTSITERSSSA